MPKLINKSRGKGVCKLNLVAMWIVLILAMAPIKPIWGFYSLLETGELPPLQKLRVTTAFQGYFDGPYSLANFVVHTDTRLTDDLSLRASLGLGSAFMAGSSIKWVPFPDYDKQPAIGLRGGLYYAYARHDKGQAQGHQIALRIEPLVSKHFDTKWGDLWPYAALSTGITSASTNGEPRTPTRILTGTEAKIDVLDGLHLIGEFGLAVGNDANHFVALGGTYQF